MGRINTNLPNPAILGNFLEEYKNKELIFLRIVVCLCITYNVHIHTYSLSQFLNFKLLNEFIEEN